MLLLLLFVMLGRMRVCSSPLVLNTDMFTVFTAHKPLSFCKLRMYCLGGKPDGISICRCSLTSGFTGQVRTTLQVLSEETLLLCLLSCLLQVLHLWAVALQCQGNRQNLICTASLNRQYETQQL